MTTKRKLIGRLVPCRCFRGEEEVISVLDYSHCSLQQVPKEIFSFERTLEELYLDANQIEELPKLVPSLFCVYSLNLNQGQAVIMILAKTKVKVNEPTECSDDLFTAADLDGNVALVPFVNEPMGSFRWIFAENTIRG
ncbi:Leucine-rich repeat-containing protein 7 [Liparis tanakae]|uniref:Leucine-rich repeat-containing protein 7 n=1 Tax=Liparis tanakae TaxID=230148 RepID=A0A4Z2FAU0_9TELE|nr:Leucine-rich repeat-containing protein 7 [Liparis tanakae]